MALAYLFECHFYDGTLLQQTQDDLSAVDPAKSAFFDVVQRMDEVMVFGLVNDAHTYAVDLRDGHFEIDGVAFTVNPTDQIPEEGEHKYRLIYFRRHRHSVLMTEGGLSAQDAGHTVEYHFGWQTTVDGKNYQSTIALS